MASERYIAHWWLPKDPENQQPGVLHLDGKDMRLELVGGFPTIVVEKIDAKPELGLPESWAHDGEREFMPVIFGRTADGKDFTLFDCYASTRHVMNFATMAFVATSQVIIVNKWLRGRHVPSLDDPIFHSFEFELDRLAHFYSPFKPAIDVDIGGSSARLESVVPSTIIEFDGLTIEIRLNTLGFGPHRLSNRTEVRAISTAQIVIRSTEAVSYNRLNKYTKAFQDLVTLASGQASGFITETLDKNTPGAATVEVRRRPVHGPAPDAEFADWSKFLFTCDDLSADQLIPKWLGLWTKLGPAIALVLAQVYSGNSYLEEKAIAVASAAEAVHTRQYDKPAQPKEQFNALMEQMLLGVTEAADKQWIRSRFSNTFSFKHRLIDLALQPDQEAVSLAIPAPRDWADRVVQARNSIAHGNLSRKLWFDQWSLLIRETTVLLYLVIMHELGIGPERQKHVALDNQLHHLRERMRLGAIE